MNNLGCSNLFSTNNEFLLNHSLHIMFATDSTSSICSFSFISFYNFKKDISPLAYFCIGLFVLKQASFDPGQLHNACTTIFVSLSQTWHKSESYTFLFKGFYLVGRISCASFYRKCFTIFYMSSFQIDSHSCSSLSKWEL